MNPYAVGDISNLMGKIGSFHQDHQAPWRFQRQLVVELVSQGLADGNGKDLNLQTENVRSKDGRLQV